MSISEQSKFDLNLIQSSVRDMIENGLEDSADKLCSLVISGAGGLSPDDLSMMLELHGDCVFANKEYRRALMLYRQAFPQCTQSDESSSHDFSQKNIYTPRQAILRRKECECHIHLDDHTIALRELESIPTELRDIKTNVSLAKLYKNAGLRRHAVTTLQLVLTECPLAIECIEMLSQLGTKESDLSEFPKSSVVDFLPLVRKSIYSNTQETTCDLEPVEELSRCYPESSFALTQLAIKSYEAEKLDQAMDIFKKIRRIDRYSFEGMDFYCKELYERSDILELSKLATDILHAQSQFSNSRKIEQSAIGWVAAGMYTLLKGDEKGDQAMGFVDKACKINPRCYIAFNTKGRIYMRRDKPEQASIAYSQANSIKKNVESLAGLVEVNLRLGKFNEALAAAKSALKLKPSSSQCFAMLGKVIMKSDSANGRNEAKLVLKKALKLNPKNVAAALALSDVLCKEDSYEQAYKCLMEVVEVMPTYKLRCRLGKVLGILGRHDEAIQQLHCAMSTAPTPDLSEALTELEMLEGSMRGTESELEVNGMQEYDEWGDERYDSPHMMEFSFVPER